LDCDFIDLVFRGWKKLRVRGRSILRGDGRRAGQKQNCQNQENQENMTKQQNKICFARPRTGLDGPIWQGLGTMATGSNKTK
jgi:hypothetical protein